MRKDERRMKEEELVDEEDPCMFCLARECGDCEICSCNPFRRW